MLGIPRKNDPLFRIDIRGYPN